MDNAKPTPASTNLDRRSFLVSATAALAATGTAFAQTAKPNEQDAVKLSPIHATSEAPEKTPGPFEAPDQRVGFAVVGLGRLSINQILPAFAASKYCKVTALVSGDAVKAKKIAAQYGIPQNSLYDYQSYDQIAKNPTVQVIYIVLPNSMHREYVERGAKTGKHILCEKPMATSVKDCEAMIAACAQAGVKLMIAYRQQYEPTNRALVKMRQEGKLGSLKSIIATNAQEQGDPAQWRLKKALAGGGCLPDVGIYCFNAARFISGEEPIEVTGMLTQPKDDPRFAEVEETCTATLRFPSGLIAIINSGYGAHKSQAIRVEGDKAYAELNPAFGYHGLKLKVSKPDLEMGVDVGMQPAIPDKDQFAIEMDHMALCVQQNLQPHTGGEEGLQDQRIVDALYESARTGKAVKLMPPAKPTRGPEPTES